MNAFSTELKQRVVIQNLGLQSATLPSKQRLQTPKSSETTRLAHIKALESIELDELIHENAHRDESLLREMMYFDRF